VNNIEVLPPSPMDDQLAMPCTAPFMGPRPLALLHSGRAFHSHHRQNGNVTLEGVVDSETDKNLAGLRANQVPNVFSVKNNLVVAG